MKTHDLSAIQSYIRTLARRHCTANENIGLEDALAEISERLTALETKQSESVTKLGTKTSDLPFPALLEAERKRYASIMAENVKLKMEVKEQKQKMGMLIAEQARDRFHYDDIHSLLNDIALLVPLPGSPDYKDCLLWVKENLPKLQEEENENV